MIYLVRIPIVFSICVLVLHGGISKEFQNKIAALNQQNYFLFDFQV